MNQNLTMNIDEESKNLHQGACGCIKSHNGPRIGKASIDSGKGRLRKSFFEATNYLHC